MSHFFIISFFLLLTLVYSINFDKIIVFPTFSKVWIKDEIYHIFEDKIESINTNNQLVFPTPDYIQLNSTQGQSIVSSYLKLNFDNYLLSILAQFETQKTQTWCSLASLANILHGVNDIEIPIDYSYNPYPFATQESIFRNMNMPNESSCASSVISIETITQQGATLNDLSKIGQCYFKNKYNVETHFASESTLEEWIETIRNQEKERTLIIINFSRVHLSQMGGGHFSVIGHYVEEAQSALLLDTARYKYPHIYVPLDKLYLAMNTTDEVSGRSRGWITIRQNY